MVSFEETLNLFRAKGLITLLPGLFASLVFFLPFERIPSVSLTLFGTSIDVRLSFIAGMLLIAAVAYELYSRRITVQRSLRTIYIVLAGFFFSYGLSLLLSNDIKRAVSVWFFTAFTASIAVAISSSWKFFDQAKIRQALRISTWIVLVFGIYQYFGDIFGLSQSWTGLRDIYVKEVFGFPRIQSTGLEPLFFANFLLIPFFYFATRFISGKDERPLLLVAILVEIVLTVSRGALIGGLVGLIVLLIAHYRKLQLQQSIGFIGLNIVGVALALLLTNVGSLQIFTSAQPSAASNPATVAVINQATNLTSQDDRVRNRTLALEAFRSSPVFGIGPGNFSAYAKDHFASYAQNDGYIVVNNEPLELLAESGVVGFVFFATFILMIVWKLIRIIVHHRDELTFQWAASILAYLTALAIQYQTFSTLYIVHVWVILGIALGLISHNTQSTKTSKNA